MTRIGPIHASDSLQVAIILEAAIAGAPVEVTGEYTAPRGSGGKAAWKFGWRWDLGDATLADILQQHFDLPWPTCPGSATSSRARSPPGISLAPRPAGLSFGIADLSFVYVQADRRPRLGHRPRRRPSDPDLGPRRHAAR